MESSTKILRAMLDERGVEWAEYGDGYTEFCTRQVVDGKRHYTDVGHYTVQPNVMGSLIVAGLTPEQVIEATLGREPDDAAMVKLHDLMNAALLEYERVQGIEKRDGDGEIVVPFVAKMHSLLEEAAMLGRGTCHLTSAPQYGEGCQECSSCGAVLDGYLFDGGRCPNCRAKVVDE